MALEANSGALVDDGRWWHRHVEIGVDGCIDGTERPLIGVLVAHFDAVAGTPPSGTINPTVDLQVRLFSAPRLGIIHFRARTLRLGRTLYVGEAEMSHDTEEVPFGIGTATFMNRPLPFPERGGHGAIYKRLTDVDKLSDGTFEMTADLSGPQGTVSGASLGRLAEIAAVDLLASYDQVAAIADLDLRFLNKVKFGPTRATASVVGPVSDTTTVRVEITDTGDNDRLVTYALAVCRPVAPQADERDHLNQVPGK